MNDDCGSDAVEGLASTEAEEQRELEGWARRLSLSVDDLKVFCRRGFHYEKVPSTNTPARRALLAYLKRAQDPVTIKREEPDAINVGAGGNLRIPREDIGDDLDAGQDLDLAAMQAKKIRKPNRREWTAIV